MLIFIPINPADICTAQQKGAMIRGGRIHFYTKKRVRDSEDAIVSALAPYRDAVRGALLPDEAVAVDINFCFGYTKSTPKKLRPDVTPHIVRPDLDNLAKGVLDAMTKAGFFADDSLVADLHLRKIRVCAEPFIAIHIAPFND